MKKKAFNCLLVLLVLTLLTFCFPLPAQASSLPYHIHLSWVENDAHHSIVITWSNDRDLLDYTPTVKYGTTSGKYQKTVVGFQEPPYSSNAKVDVSSATLTNLESGTSYYYICGDENYGWSGEYKFTTPPGGAPFRFAAYGDTRNPTPIFEDSANINFKVWDRIQQKMKDENPLFSIFTGDNVNPGTSESLWNTWFEKLSNGTGPTSVFMPTYGNHESPGTIQ
ncbi:MAG: fibronectin type III domain-containing protein, partial [Actinomycetota bacterium]|nr:fibronectin type III domain-containing protein [Actinomycetota bacterium]